RQHKDQFIFGGRLGQYRYFDMDQVFNAALNEVRKEFKIPSSFNFAHDEEH
ncbi:MAG: UDP-galactopyranose mutase, partial [Weissella confusa]